MAIDWIMTATGRVFYPLAPKPDDVVIEDIAHALAATNRFNGHTREPYSVAQHSVLVSIEMERRRLDSDWATRALYGLLHDASEAYLCDVPRPLKRQPEFAAYRQAEDRLQDVIFRVFGLNPDEKPWELGQVDRRMLRTEQQHLMPPAAPGEDRNDVAPLRIIIRPWTFSFAKDAFLNRYADLTSWSKAASA